MTPIVTLTVNPAIDAFHTADEVGRFARSAPATARSASPARGLETKSVVGAGDAFLGAMIKAVAAGGPLGQAFALAVATRVAAERLLPEVAAPAAA